MSDEADPVEVELTCPTCRTLFTTPVDRSQAMWTVHCPRCGQQIRLSAEEED